MNMLVLCFLLNWKLFYISSLQLEPIVNTNLIRTAPIKIYVLPKITFPKLDIKEEIPTLTKGL